MARMDDYHCSECSKTFKWGTDEDSPMVTEKNCGENAHWKLNAHMLSEHPGSFFKCPYGGGLAFWRGGTYQHCSHCGSLHPDDFIKALENGNQITPTDKNYKAYIDIDYPVLIDADTGEQIGKYTIYMSSTHPGEGMIQLTDELCDQYGLSSYYRKQHAGKGYVKISQVQPGPDNEKFYYPHLSKDQQDRFIELYNEKKMNIATPGYFYRPPFFCAPSTTKPE